MQTVSDSRRPLFLVINFGPSGVLALPVAAGTNEGGHYWSERFACASGANFGRPLFSFHFFWNITSRHRNITSRHRNITSQHRNITSRHRNITSRHRYRCSKPMKEVSWDFKFLRGLPSNTKNKIPMRKKIPGTPPTPPINPILTKIWGNLVKSTLQTRVPENFR